MKSIKKIHVIFFILLIQTGCRTLKPEAPAVVSEQFVLKPQVSEVNIPVEISIAGMEKTINQELQGLIYEDNDLKDNGGDNLMLKVWKLQDIKIDVRNDIVYYTLPLKLWIKYGFEISKFGLSVSNYNEGECALSIRFMSKVTLDSAWNVTTQTQANGYDWIEKPMLKIVGMDLPITTIANLYLKRQQQQLAQEIDAMCKKNLNIKPYVDQAWQKIQEPIMITNDPETWLDIKPLEARMVPFSGKNGKITSAISVKAFAESRISRKPVKNKVKLPNLAFDSNSKNNFSIAIVAAVNYEDATTLAKKYLLNQIFTFKDKYTVKVTNLNIYPNGNKIAIGMDVEGSIKGKIYLKGVPYFDPKTNDFAVKDVDFDLDTKNKLLSTADWLVHGFFQKKVESSMRYPLGKDLNESKTMIQKSISNATIAKGIVLNGTVVDLLPKDIVLTEEDIKVVLWTQGNLQLRIDSLD